jgi:hypothetical protein
MKPKPLVSLNYFTGRSQKGMHYAYIFVQGGAPMMVVDRFAIGSLICAFAMPLSEIKAKFRFGRMLEPWITSRHTSPACGRK